MAKFTIKSIAAAPILLSASFGCVPPGDGVKPPAERIYFPVSLAMSKSHRLIVVNSDFDLQFSQGTVQSLDADRIKEVTQQPCNSDGDCNSDRFCDIAPSEDNGSSPSYVCVQRDDPRPCASLGEKSQAQRAVSPGRCSWVDLKKPQDGGARLLVDVAETAAFATQGLLLSRPCKGGTGDGSRSCEADEGSEDLLPSRSGEAYPERLFIPVRGDTTIHYLEVDEEGRFICGRPLESSKDTDFDGASTRSLRCDPDYRISTGTTFGLDEDGNFVKTDKPPLPGDLDDDELSNINSDPDNEFRLQPEPIDLAASSGGRFITISHQVGGMVSSMMNNWLDPPALIHVLRDLSPNPLGVTSIPKVHSDDMTASEFESSWDFLLSYRSSPQIDLLHLSDDGLLEGAYAAKSNEGGAAVKTFRPELVRIDSTTITTNSPGTHSRGLVVDDRPRIDAIEACAGDASCEQTASKTPLTVYATNRSPSSLLIGQTGGESLLAQASLTPRFFNTIPLSAGPSRVVLGNVIGPDGALLPRVFVICFDSAIVFIFDPVRGVVESEIRTGRGPYSLAFNYEQGAVYVGHFTDSYIGVISIDQRFPFTYGATLATLGEPKSPRAQK